MVIFYFMCNKLNCMVLRKHHFVVSIRNTPIEKIRYPTCCTNPQLLDYLRSCKAARGAYLLIKKRSSQGQPPLQSHHKGDTSRYQAEGSKSDVENASHVRREKLVFLQMHDSQHTNDSYQIVDDEALQHQNVLRVASLRGSVQDPQGCDVSNSPQDERDRDEEVPSGSVPLCTRAGNISFQMHVVALRLTRSFPLSLRN